MNSEAWPIFLAGWGVCVLLSLSVSLLLWLSVGAPPSTFTLGSAVSSIIGVLYGVASLTLLLHAALGWHLIFCLAASVIPGWALGFVLAFLVDGFCRLIEISAQKMSRRRRDPG